jgi:hypothetical protein
MLTVESSALIRGTVVAHEEGFFEHLAQSHRDAIEKLKGIKPTQPLLQCEQDHCHRLPCIEKRHVWL